MTDAFFLPLGDRADDRDDARTDGAVARFEATAACGGPWDENAMHGGPPSALLVRACERAALAPTPGRVARGGDAPDRPLVALRTVVDFLGPIPVAPVEVRAQVVRGGRRITLAEAALWADGRPLLQARTWLLRTTSDDAPEPLRSAALAAADPAARPDDVTHPAPQACPPALTDWAFPYARAVEWRHVAGDPGGPGDAAAWARQRIPLVAGDEPSGLQRAVLVADSGNGISAALDWGRWSFVNIDLAVHLSRPLEGAWVLLDARTRYEPGGTGLATSVLHDEVGAVGTGAQTLLVSRHARPGAES